MLGSQKGQIIWMRYVPRMTLFFYLPWKSNSGKLKTTIRNKPDPNALASPSLKLWRTEVGFLGSFLIRNLFRGEFLIFRHFLCYYKYMQTITTSKKELRQIVKESVRDVLDTELMKLRSLALPTVSSKEQKEIEKSLRKADRSASKRIRLL